MDNIRNNKAHVGITLPPKAVAPLDQLIYLIAQIEVEKYLQESNHHPYKDAHDESSHLRTL